MEKHVMGARERAKHMGIRKHFAHQVMHKRHSTLVRVPTSSQLTDILTEPLHLLQWQACVAGIVTKVATSEGTSVLKRGR